MDTYALSKENEKVDKYLTLSIELQSLRNTTIEVVPIVLDALGSLSDSIFSNLNLLQITDNQLQRWCYWRLQQFYGNIWLS